MKTIKSLIRKIYTRIGIGSKIRDITITLPPKDEIDESLVVDNTPLEMESEKNKDE